MVKELRVLTNILGEIRSESIQASKEDKEIFGFLTGVLDAEKDHAFLNNKIPVCKLNFYGNAFISTLRTLPRLVQGYVKINVQKNSLKEAGKQPFVSAYQSDDSFCDWGPLEEEAFIEDVKRGQDYEAAIKYFVRSDSFSALNKKLEEIPVVPVPYKRTF